MTQTQQAIENRDMVVTLYQQYKSDHVAALREASKIQRELSRAEHKANRLQKHLTRIEAFCKQHNLSLEEQ